MASSRNRRRQAQAKMTLGQRFPRAPAASAPVAEPIIITVPEPVEPDQKEEKHKEKQFKLDEKALKQEEKLLKAFAEFNKKFAPSKEGGIGGYFKDKASNLKKLGSIEGLAGLMGVTKDSGTFAGAVLGSLSARGQRKAAKKEYIENFAQFTDFGRSMTAKEAKKEAERRYTGILSTGKEIEKLSERREKAKEFGGSLSEAEQNRLSAAMKQHEELTTYSVPDKSKSELLEGVASGVKAEIGTMSAAEKQALHSADPEYLKGVFEGALGSLTKVNEEQLDQLVALVKASTKSEEERLEEGNKKNVAASLGTEEKKEEKKGNFLSTIFDLFSNKLLGRLGSLFSSFGSTLMQGLGRLSGFGARVVSGLGTAASGAARVGGSIASGAANLGSKVVSGLGSAASGAANLGSKALGGLSKMASGGAKLAAKAAGPLAAALDVGLGANDLLEGKRQEEMPSGWDVISPMRWGMWAGEKINKGYESLSGGSSIGSSIYDLMHPGEAEKLNAPTPIPGRVAQKAELSKAVDAMEAKKKPETAPQNVVTNAPTTIINNNTQQKPGRSPVRNIEPSYNRRMDRLLLA